MEVAGWNNSFFSYDQYFVEEIKNEIRKKKTPCIILPDYYSLDCGE